MIERQPVKLIFPDGLERRFTSMSSAAGYIGTTPRDISSALYTTENPSTPGPLQGVQVLVWEKPSRPSHEWVVVRKQDKLKVDQKLTTKLRANKKFDCTQYYIIVKAVSFKQAIFLAANGKEYDDKKHIGIVSVHLGDDSVVHQD